MAKRFIDTELWDREEFNSSDQKMKLLTIFITCKCDAVGVFKMAPMLINAYVGDKVTEKEILSIPCEIIKVDSSTYWLTRFCSFQYGVLSDKCRPHRKYIDMLKKHGLFEGYLKGIKENVKGYSKGIETLEEKEQEQDKEQDKDIKGLLGENNFSTSEVDSVQPLKDPGAYYKFLEIYPKQGRFDNGYTKNAFYEAVKDLDGDEPLMMAVTFYAAFVEVTNQEDQYIPDPKNWLSKGRYRVDWMKEREKWFEKNDEIDPAWIKEAAERIGSAS